MSDDKQPVLEDNSLEGNNEEAEPAVVQSASPDVATVDKDDKESFFKKLTAKYNIYILLLAAVLLGLGIIVYFAYRQNSKANQQNELKTQKLTQEAVDKLAANDATVGDPKQTLTIESNAIFNGGLIVKGNTDITGTMKLGGALTVPSLNVNGSLNIDQLAAKSLTVAGDGAIQGKLTIQNGLNVNGSANFSGTLSAGTLSVSSLQLTKDLVLSRHLTATGSGLNRSNGGALGSGGTANNNGNDTAGTITINTGGSAPAGCFVTLSFNQSFGTTPKIILSPASSSAASLSYYVSRSSTSFSLCTASDPPDNTGGIIFDYFVIG